MHAATNLNRTSCQPHHGCLSSFFLVQDSMDAKTSNDWLEVIGGKLCGVWSSLLVDWLMRLVMLIASSVHNVGSKVERQQDTQPGSKIQRQKLKENYFKRPREWSSNFKSVELLSLASRARINCRRKVKRVLFFIAKGKNYGCSTFYIYR